jgi:hypothetical protein
MQHDMATNIGISVLCLKASLRMVLPHIKVRRMLAYSAVHPIEQQKPQFLKCLPIFYDALHGLTMYKY